MTIGRNKPSSGGTSTGHGEPRPRGELQPGHQHHAAGQFYNIFANFSVSATNLLTFNAYNVGAGSAGHLRQQRRYLPGPATIILTTDQTGGPFLHGLFLSNAAGGSVQITTKGNLNLFGSVIANSGNASKIIVNASGKIAIDNQDQIKQNSSTFYNSLSAFNGVSDTTSEIDLTAGQASGIGIFPIRARRRNSVSWSPRT